MVFPRRGTFVSEVHLTDRSLISDVRRQLESHAARRAALRATEEDRARLETLEQAIAHHPGGRAASMRLDTDIHREIYRCAHNHFLEPTSATTTTCRCGSGTSSSTAYPRSTTPPSTCR